MGLRWVLLAVTSSPTKARKGPEKRLSVVGSEKLRWLCCWSEVDEQLNDGKKIGDGFLLTG
jgi:hypothetical protein